MAAIGKLLVLSCFVAAIGMLTWSTTLYAERPQWFSETTDTVVDRGNNFKQLKAEIDSLSRASASASESWGTYLRTLEAREKLRADRKAAFDQRVTWALKGNPNDLIDSMNAKTGRGFYVPFIDEKTRLHDLTLVKGKPRGAPIQGTDGNDLTGLENSQTSITADTEASSMLYAQILEGTNEFQKLSEQVAATDERLKSMGIIRDSVQAELFFLMGFEVNASEARDTVLRRERQLRNRLKSLGVNDP